MKTLKTQIAYITVDGKIDVDFDYMRTIFERELTNLWNTTEDNKTIAEFMGMQYGDDGTMCYDDAENTHPPTSIDSLAFKTSWDWLIPVVQKCYKIDNEQGFDALVDAVSTLDIDGTYSAVVEFINTNNNLN